MYSIMFYDKQDASKQKLYREYLQLIGSLSNLFSSSDTPYLYYRIAEKMFCQAFDADDLSRGDVSYDAKKDFLGIGLKTFLKNKDNTLQKIAEFNKDMTTYNKFSDLDKIKEISKLRNARLDFTNNLYDIKDSIYHCVLRDKNKFYIYEEKTDHIDIDAIKKTKVTKSSLFFNDGKHEYSFALSKSTLMKRFTTKRFLDDFDINILNNPLESLYGLLDNTKKLTKIKILDTIFLPLYGRNMIVHEKSALNQWKASGRDRHPDEVYIPIPIKIHKYKPDFFPARDSVFKMKLPNGNILNTKVCQENSKALMSNPNKALGKWILRDIFKLKEGVSVTNATLLLYGIDSVRIDKISNFEYEINFSATNSYENFVNNLVES